MQAEIKRLIKFLPDDDYEEALILLSQEDYQGIHKIAIKILRRMKSLIELLGEEIFIDDEDE